jgi:hypothetical protein
MNRYGGCFAPESPVKLFDGTTCEIRFLMPGMRVWGGAHVVNMLRLNYRAFVPMVSLDAASGNPNTRTLWFQTHSKYYRLCCDSCDPVASGFHRRRLDVSLQCPHSLPRLHGLRVQCCSIHGPRLSDQRRRIHHTWPRNRRPFSA